MRDFVASQKGRLRLFFLPPYSPELNPDEQVWNYVKHHGIGKATRASPRISVGLFMLASARSNASPGPYACSDATHPVRRSVSVRVCLLTYGRIDN